VRPFGALSGWLVRRHLRGPLVPFTVILFAAVALAQPTLGDPGSALRHRGMVALELGAGGLVLTLLALVLPYASLRLRRVSVPGGGPTIGVRQLGAFCGHAIIVLTTACLLAIATHAFVLMKVGDPDQRGRPPLVRQIWARVPDKETSLPRVGDALDFELPFSALPREQPIVRLRLAPRLISDGSRSTNRAHGGLDAGVDLLWRVKKTGGLVGPLRDRDFRNHEILRFSRGRPEIVELRLADAGDILRAGGGDWLAGSVQVRLRRRGGGQVPLFDPGSILLFGTRGSALATVFRSYLLLAVSALAVLATCQWFSGFVSYPLAVAATLTIVLASTTVAPWLPGAPIPDPAKQIGFGGAVGWTDLLPVLAKTGVMCAVIGGLPLVDRRIAGGGS